MAATGNSFETPRACPFVALELDRDRRADKPDYRHRCFAEPTPAPRSLAHQEAYCLSPSFAACPIFQDWAVRAAARPATTGGAAVPSGGADVAPAPADLSAPMSTPTPTPVSELPEDASVTPAGAALAAAASPPTFATTGWEDEVPDNEQLGVFDAPPGAAAATGIAGAALAGDSSRGDWPTGADEARSSYGEPDASYQEPPAAPAFVPPPAQPSSSNKPDPAAAAVPAFLAGRPARTDAPSYSANAPPPPRATPPPPAREEIVPSWEIDGRYGAEGPIDHGGGGRRFDGVLTAVAVIAILAIGVAAVLFLPGLLNNKGATTRTPAPSFATGSGLPTVAPTVLVSAVPSSVPSAPPATAVATTSATLGPEPTPHLYKIKPGDSLARIANKFDVTVQQIIDANPQITDPDHILVGFTIIIPPSATVTIPPTAAP